MQTKCIDNIYAGDEIRVRNARMSASGTVEKVNRVNIICSSSVFGNPVTFKIRKDEMIGGQVATKDGVFTITATRQVKLPTVEQVHVEAAPAEPEPFSLTGGVMLQTSMAQQRLF